MGAEGVPPLVALTGGSGFLGAEVVRALTARGARVRLLMRRQTPTSAEVVLGDLGDPDALRRLPEGASVVVHVAGLVKALTAAEFDRVNRAGAQAMAEAARDVAPDARFLLVSSLAAREPQLSPYAASKRAGEAAVAETLGSDRLTVVRPPGIYGPGDREFLPLFRAVRRGTAPVFGARAARIALIHVADAAEAIAELALGRARPGVWTLYDERPDGYAWSEIVSAAARAAGSAPPALVRTPSALLKAAAAVSGFAAQLRGRPAMLTSGKARELLHPDWSVREGERPPGLAPARFSLEDGFRDTVSWYRRHGWLPG